MDEAFQVRALREDDDVSAITRLLHAAYAPLAEMGFRYLASHQKDDVTLRRLRQGFAFVGVMSGQIVATLTLRPPDPDSPCAWYRESGVFSVGQFAVLPSLQRQGIGLRLIQMAELQACGRGASHLALDTAEGATHLRRWYERLIAVRHGLGNHEWHEEHEGECQGLMGSDFPKTWRQWNLKSEITGIP